MLIDVSIVIINYRTPQLIINCLTSIYKFTHGIGLEIVIVDNDPKNGGGSLIREAFPSVQYIEMEFNSGFGRANNRGMQNAAGRYFLLLNADTLVQDDVISQFVKKMDARPDIVASGAMQYDAANSPMNFYKSFSDFRKTFLILPPSQFFENLLDKLYPEPEYADPEQYDWLVGAFIFLRREAFKITGGFDEDFFMYGEDVEWSGRLGKLGKLCYFKDYKFIHLENENPFRRTRISWINRFSTQMQVSNLLWVRKQYGVFSYLALITHYIVMIPVVYGWKIMFNLKKNGQPFSELKTQYIYTRKSRVLLKYFWKTLTLKKGLYKILPSENIDLLTSS
jgi:GT2 family glycosyltransferase